MAASCTRTSAAWNLLLELGQSIYSLAQLKLKPSYSLLVIFHFEVEISIPCSLDQYLDNISNSSYLCHLMKNQVVHWQRTLFVPCKLTSVVCWFSYIPWAWCIEIWDCEFVMYDSICTSFFCRFQICMPFIFFRYDAYSFSVIPAVGELVTGDRESYQYLVESIRRFPPQVLRVEVSFICCNIR